MVCLLALLSVPAVMMASAATVPKAQSYQPTTIGDTSVWESLEDKTTQTTVVIAATPRGAEIFVTEEVTFASANPAKTGTDSGPGYRLLSVSDKGVFGLGHAGGPPACLLKLPLKPGDEWEPEYLCKVTVRGQEKVTVGAGTFTAYRLETVSKPRNADLTFRNIAWYAPGVGGVRSALMDGDKMRVTGELKSFTPGNGTLPAAKK